MDGRQLQTWLDRNNCDAEVVSRNHLKDNAPGRAYVVNLDNDDQPGSHWVAIWIGCAGAEYFDPIGLPPLFTDIEQFMDKASGQWTYNDAELQSVDSDVCGHYCLFYLFHRRRGMPLAYVQYIIASTRGDDIVKQFVKLF